MLVWLSGLLKTAAFAADTQKQSKLIVNKVLFFLYEADTVNEYNESENQ